MRLFKYLKNKDYRIYCKMNRRHRRELVKLAKNTHDYDYDYLHRLVILKLRHFLEYYESGYNVWQTDETLIPLINSLKETLSIVDDFENSDSPDEEKFYEEFYSTIGKNIMFWWD